MRTSGYGNGRCHGGGRGGDEEAGRRAHGPSLDAAAIVRGTTWSSTKRCAGASWPGCASGLPLGAVLGSAESHAWRREADPHSLGVYEKLRHQARLRLIALGLAEGMTTADIQSPLVDHPGGWPAVPSARSSG